jgi:hypothetical protein
VLASEAPISSISKNQKKSFKPRHFYAKLSIKIDISKCLKITVVMLVYISVSVSNQPIISYNLIQFISIAPIGNEFVKNQINVLAYQQDHPSTTLLFDYQGIF